MIPLSKSFVERISRTLEPGFIVQLEQVGSDVQIKKVPKDESNIYITPVLTSLEGPTMLDMTLRKTGEDPVIIPTVVLPQGYWITGLLGARNVAKD